MSEMKTTVDRTRRASKKYVRYKEGAELFSMGLSKFQKMAHEAKATYKVRHHQNVWRCRCLGLHIFPIPA